MERTILASCLQNPNNLIEVKDNEITGDMFLIEANRYIFFAIEYLNSKNQEASPMAIVEVLKDKHAKKVVEDFGGSEYLTLLTEQHIDNNVKIFCEKLKQAYTKAKMFSICEDYNNFLLSDQTEVLNPTEITSKLEFCNQINYQLAFTFTYGLKILQLKQISQNYWKILQKLREKPCRHGGLKKPRQKSNTILRSRLRDPYRWEQETRDAKRFSPRS